MSGEIGIFSIKKPGRWNRPDFLRTNPRGGLLPLGDHFLQFLAGLELNNLLGLDVDGFLGLGIDALASSALGNFEGAEADELNLVALLEGVLEGIEHGFESLLSGGLIQLGLLGNGLHEICFIHPGCISLQICFLGLCMDYKKHGLRMSRGVSKYILHQDIISHCTRPENVMTPLSPSQRPFLTPSTSPCSRIPVVPIISVTATCLLIIAYSRHHSRVTNIHIRGQCMPSLSSRFLL